MASDKPRHALLAMNAIARGEPLNALSVPELASLALVTVLELSRIEGGRLGATAVQSAHARRELDELAVELVELRKGSHADDK